MSIYSIQAECDSFLYDAEKAIESELRYEDHPFDSALEESLAESVSSISENFSKRAGEIYKNFNVAYKKKDYNAAMKSLNDLENTVRQWDAKLKELPPEKMSRTVIKNTIRIIAVIAGIAIVLFGSFAFAKVFPTAVMKLIGRGAPKALASKGSATAAAYTAVFGTSYAGGKMSGTALGKLLTDQANKKLYRQKHGTEHDPNAHNGRYVAEVLLIDQWLKTIARLKKKLQDMQAGK